MQEFIPLSVPNLKGNELKYVTEAINSEWVSTAGPYVSRFEEKIAEYVKVKGAVACQSGTAGLHIALLNCNITKNDEVIVPTLTFIAAVNPVKYIGAEPIFIDCDDSLCMDAKKLEEFCLNECYLKDNKLFNKKTKKHVKAIVVVHVFGNMADMENILDTAKKFNLKVIEDATEAIGTYYKEGKYKNKFAGTMGDIGVYSFNGNKIMTTGGGGMIVSNNEKVLERSKYLTTQAKADTLYYIHDEIGYNYRMTNIQAALGVAQLEELDTFIKTKKENYKYYAEKIKDIKGLELLKVRDDISSNYWFYALKIKCDYSMKRDKLIKYLYENKIQTRPIWGLISDQKPYKSSQKYKINKAKEYIKEIINLPCSSNLKKADIDYITQKLDL